MKKHLITLAASACCAGPAFAQSSVTLYGILDEGINYTNNTGGNHLFELASGYAYGSRWGIKGSEDLGGGNKAILQLENGFDASSGRAAQGGRMFGRQAYVGVSGNEWGTVTLGRQYDSMVNYVSPLTTNGNWSGWLLAHPYDNDNTDNSFRLSQSVKYASPDFNGFQFGGAYAFSNNANFAANRAYSVGAKYNNGGLALGAAYMQADQPGVGDVGAIASNDASFIAQRMRVFGAGVNYTLGLTTLGFVYTNSNYQNPTGNGYLGTPGDIIAPGATLGAIKYQNFEVNGKYQLTPAFFVGGQYVLTLGKHDASTASPQQKIHSVGLMADYNFSKRTDVYLQTAYQHVAGGKTGSVLDQAYIVGTAGPSSTTSQTVVRVALRHLF